MAPAAAYDEIADWYEQEFLASTAAAGANPLGIDAALASLNAGDLRSAGGCQALLSVCRCRRVVMADRGCDLDDPQVGAGLAGRVLVPAAERGFDPAGADAWPAGRVQAGQDGPADVPGQVARAVQDVAGAGDQGLGCFDGDLVAGPVGVGARDGGHGVGDRDPQRLVEGQQRPDLWLHACLVA